MKRTIGLQASLVVISTFILGCGQFKPEALGSDEEILVFADSSDWTMLEQPVREAFEVEVLTPQPEMLYAISRHPISDYPDINTHKNLLIVAPLSSNGPTAKFISGSLSSEVRPMVESGQQFVINKYDLYRREQLVMFVTARDMDTLIGKIRANRRQLLYYFQKESLEREIADVYSDRKFEQVDLEKRFLKNYGWRIFVQPDYWVAVDSSSERFVWLRRANPADMERWISVYWADNANPDLLHQAWAFELRNELTKRFYRTTADSTYVEIADDFDSMKALSIEETNFLGRYCLETRGLWRFSDRSGGGPFVNYTFYDEASRRIYMIDASVYAPRYEKKKLILQVDAVAHTFQTLNDLTEEQKEKILGKDWKKEVSQGKSDGNTSH